MSQQHHQHQQSFDYLHPRQSFNDEEDERSQAHLNQPTTRHRSNPSHSSTSQQHSSQSHAYRPSGDPDLDSPAFDQTTTLETPHFSELERDPVPDGVGSIIMQQQQQQQHHHDDEDDRHSDIWSGDSDSDSQASNSQDAGGWYGGAGSSSEHHRMIRESQRGVGGSNSSSTSRLVHLAEEEEQYQESNSTLQHALMAKLEATRRKKQLALNSALPCPRICGASWGIGGQLVYWSNLPLLTHYLVENQRRRTATRVHDDLNSVDDSTAQHQQQQQHLHQASLDPTSAIVDHDEDEAAAWAGATAGSTSLSFPAISATSPAHPPPLHIDVNEVLPRTYEDLLHLPFVAAHLGYVVGEDMEDVGDDGSTPDMIAGSEDHSPIATVGGGVGGVRSGITPIRASPEPLAGFSAFVPVHSRLSSSPDALSSASPQDTTSVPIASNFSRGLSVSLANVTLPSDAAEATDSVGSAPLSQNINSNFTASSTSSLALGTEYDLLDDDPDMILANGFGLGMNAMMAPTSGGAANSTAPAGSPPNQQGAAGAAPAGTEDFFTSFYNSTLQLGVSAVGAVGSFIGGATGVGGPAAVEVASSGSSETKPPNVIMVPPLPASLVDPHRRTVKRIGSSTSITSSPRSGHRVDGLGGDVDALRAVLPPDSLSGHGGSNPHSWSTLASTIPSVSEAHAFTRRRIRINTSIVMMNCEEIIPFCQQLATGGQNGHDCLMGDSPTAICLANRQLCLDAYRFDLAASWDLAATITSPLLLSSEPSLTPWSENPMGGRLAEMMVGEYLKKGDVQMAALLTAVFSWRAGQYDLLTSMLPAAPPPAIIQVQELSCMIEGEMSVTPIASNAGGVAGVDDVIEERTNEGETHETSEGIIADDADETPSSSSSQSRSASNSNLSNLHSPTSSPSPSIMRRPMHSGSSSIAHPMSLLPATADGSSRTWTAGSKQRPIGPPKGNIIARGFAAAAQAIKAGYTGSGTNSPIHGDSIQRQRWREGSSFGGSSEDIARVRAGSLTTPQRPTNQQQQHRRAESKQENDNNTSTAATPILPPSSIVSPRQIVESPNSVVQFASPLPKQPSLLTLHLTARNLYLHIYASLLDRLQMYHARAKILKFVAHTETDTYEQEETTDQILTGYSHRELECGARAVCGECGTEQEDDHYYRNRLALSSPPSSSSSSSSPTSPHHSHSHIAPVSRRCTNCSHYPLICSICETSVRGSYLMCPNCGHGGHPHHIMEWFMKQEEEEENGQQQHLRSTDDAPADFIVITCPTGCGCSCRFPGASAVAAANAHRRHASTSSIRRRKKEAAEREALEAEQRQQQAQIEAQLADQEEDQQQGDDPEQVEQLQHFYNPAAFSAGQS